MSIQTRKLTQAGADYWNEWAKTPVEAGQEVMYNPSKVYDTYCNGESWCLIDNHTPLKKQYFQPLEKTEQEQAQ